METMILIKIVLISTKSNIYKKKILKLENYLAKIAGSNQVWRHPLAPSQSYPSSDLVLGYKIWLEKFYILDKRLMSEVRCYQS